MGRGESGARIVLPTVAQTGLDAATLALWRGRAERAILRRTAQASRQPSDIDRFLVITPPTAGARGGYCRATLEEAGRDVLAACRSHAVVLGITDLDHGDDAGEPLGFEVQVELDYIERKQDVLRGEAFSAAAVRRARSVAARYGLRLGRSYEQPHRYLAVMTGSGPQAARRFWDLADASKALSRQYDLTGGLRALWDLAPLSGPVEVPVLFCLYLVSADGEIFLTER